MNGSIGIALVVAGALLEGVAQVCLKQSARQGTGGWRWLAAGVGLFAIEIVGYTAALRILPVGVAYPLSALSYGAVVLAARLLLGERPGRRRCAGVVLVVIGASLAVPA